MMRRLLSLEEVSELLGVPVGSVRRWLYRGEGPPAVRLGRHLRFDPLQLEEWLRTRPGPGRRPGRRSAS